MRGNIGNMMKQAQQMQANMQKVQAEIALLEVTGESGACPLDLPPGLPAEARKPTPTSSPSCSV